MMNKKEVINILKNGGIGVLATDTLYGLVGQALNRETVERIYQVKGRAPEKPLIILITDLNQLNIFGAIVTKKTEEVLKKVWPGPVSVILPIEGDGLEYLDRETKTLAFRLPDNKELKEIINETGPLVAPSTNPEGLEPAKTINEAQEYFGDRVDFYEDKRRRVSEPSTLIKIINGKITVIREGKIKV